MQQGAPFFALQGFLAKGILSATFWGPSSTYVDSDYRQPTRASLQAGAYGEVTVAEGAEGEETIDFKARE